MPVSLDQFKRQLVESGLMSTDDIEAVLGVVPAEKQPQDGEQLAKLLIRQKTLTSYQATAVYQGKLQALVLGNYVILDKLGEGGMGMVLKAHHRRMNRVVALKVLSLTMVKKPESLKRFLREVQAAAKLTHPNIVAALDADEAKGTHFLVMEYVEGTDLSQLVKKDGPLPVEKAVACILQAARGLEFAHQKGVIHRDIKPANLLLDSSGTAKILDMGLARIDSSDAQHTELTSTGAVMGTVDYMSPEQALNTKHADQRSDIYSLGISLWYLLTGKPAYAGESLMEKLLAHREQPIPSLREARADVPAGLESIFRRMVAKRPEERFQSMTEVIIALQTGEIAAGSVPSVSLGPGDESKFSEFLRNLEEEALGPSPATRAATGVAPVPAASATENTAVSASGSSETDSKLAAPSRSPTARARRATEPAAWWKDRRVAIAAGTGGTLLVAIVFFLAGRDNRPTGDSGSTDNGNSVTTLTKSGNNSGSNNTGKTVSDNNKAADSTSGLEEVDLLALIDPAVDTLHGTTSLKDGIFKTSASESSSLSLPVMPSGSYEIEAQFIRTKGKYSCNFYLPAGVGRCLLVLGGWEEGSTSGIGQIDGAAGDQNATTRKSGIETGTIYALKIAVRLQGDEARIDVQLDGRPYMQWQGKQNSLSFRVVNGRPDVPKVGAFESEFEFRSLKIRSLDGTLLTLRSARPASSGRDNYALAFDGNGVVELDGGLTYKPDSCTIEAYVRVDAPAPRAEIFSLSNKGGLGLDVQEGKHWRLTHVISPKGQFGTDATQPIELGRRYHVAGVCDTDFYSIYVDGKRVVRSRQRLAATLTPGTKPSRIGFGFFGTIDEVRISRKARYSSNFTPPTRYEPDADTLALYHCDEGTGEILADSSGHNYHGRIVGAKRVRVNDAPIVPLRPTPSDAQPALQFTGAGDHVLFPDLISSGEAASIEGWFRLDSDKDMSLITIPYADATGLFRLTVANGGPQAVRVSGKRYGVGCSHSGTLPVGKYFHLAAEYTGNKWVFWLDGKKIGEKADHYGWMPQVNRRFSAIAGADNGVPLSAGQRRAPFQGAMRELRISKSARYTTEFKPNERLEADRDTLALYHCDEGSGDVLNDSSSNNNHGRVVGATWAKIASSSTVPPLAITPFDAQQARAHQEAWATYLKVPVEYTNSLGMKFRLVPPGEFVCGLSDDDLAFIQKDIDAAADIADTPEAKQGVYNFWETMAQGSAPRRTVRLTRPYYLAETELTKAQFRRFVEATNYQSIAEKTGGSGFVAGKWTRDVKYNWQNPGEIPSLDEHPVTQLAHGDAVRFAEWLSQTDKRVYRLPTSAEWEFAARAGTNTHFHCGDDPKQLPLYAWFIEDPRMLRSDYDRPLVLVSPVGKRLPNAFGLYDVHGNAQELCRDFLSFDEYRKMPATVVDPQGPATVPADPAWGVRRVTRGGWYVLAGGCHIGLRTGIRDDMPESTSGVRLLCELPMGASTPGTIDGK